MEFVWKCHTARRPPYYLLLIKNQISKLKVIKNTIIKNTSTEDYKFLK